MCESLQTAALKTGSLPSGSAANQTRDTSTMSPSTLTMGQPNANVPTGSTADSGLTFSTPASTSDLLQEKPKEFSGLSAILKSFDKVLLLDLETSGLNATYDYVMQIGAAVMQSDLSIIDTFSYRISLAGTKAKVSLEALAVQGMDLDSEATKEAIQKAANDAVALMLSGEPKQEVMKAFTAWSIKHDLKSLPVVGHNVVSFDSAFWSNLIFQTRSVHKGQALLSPVWIDTLDLARQVFPGSKLGLDVICQRLDLPSRPGGHDALQDAVLAGLAFFKMRDML